uniref:Uncharacterized protein n=1 Tax=Anopheles albimanus TaxID=7167 RepID=A0A182F7J1_ANOAL
RPPSSSISYTGQLNDDVRSPGSGSTPGPLSAQPPTGLESADADVAGLPASARSARTAVLAGQVDEKEEKKVVNPATSGGDGKFYNGNRCFPSIFTTSSPTPCNTPSLSISLCRLQ